MSLRDYTLSRDVSLPFSPIFTRRIDFHAFTFYQRNYIFPTVQRSKCASLRRRYIQPVVGRLIYDIKLLKYWSLTLLFILKYITLIIFSELF